MTTTLDYAGVRIPIKVKQESRSSIRYSITKKSVNLLMPRWMPKKTIESELVKVKNWCEKEFDKNPALLNRFRVIIYENGEFIRVFGKDFKVLIFKEPRKGITGQIVNHKYIEFRIPQNADETIVQEAIGKLMSRVLAAYFKKDIEKRVQYYNQEYFQEHIEAIRLKNNQSNWGSCSSKRNINLSSRLLFAPLDVLDYVIVHELAHLKEMNHSPRFWNIVRSVMPNYEEKEQWLKEHGETLKY